MSLIRLPVMKKYHILFAGIFLLPFTFACNSPSPEDSPKNAKDKSADLIPVAIATIQMGKFEDSVEATGVVRPIHEAHLSAQVAGQIVETLVEMGDFVEKGSALVRIDPRTYQLALDQADAQLLKAKAAYAKAKADFARNRKLHASGDISDYVFENAQLQVTATEASFKSAKAARSLAEKQLQDATLKAPFAGFVAAKQADLGNMVSPGMPLITLVSKGPLKVKIGVSEKDVVQIKKGQVAGLFFDAYPNKRFAGRVAAIGPSAEPESRTFPVEIVFRNPHEFPLKAGMVAKVRIQISAMKQAPLIPESAILREGNRTVVYVVENQMAQKRRIQLGPQKGNKIAVLQGLRAGEKVIVLGQNLLSDSSRVKIIREE